MSFPRISMHEGKVSFSTVSLQDICREICVKDAQKLLVSCNASTGRSLQLLETVFLPNKIWDQLLESFVETMENCCTYLPLIIAVHLKFQHLRKINLRNCSHLTDDELKMVIKKGPVSLDIHNCPSLTNASMDAINMFGRDLECLVVGSSVQILPLTFMVDEDTGGSETNTNGFLRTPKLRKLVIWGLRIKQFQKDDVPQSDRSSMLVGGAECEASNKLKILNYWEYLTRSFVDKLEYLDLSSCEELLDLGFLVKAKHTLSTLILHDVPFKYERCVLKNFSELKYFDVSQSHELKFVDEHLIERDIISFFPKLEALDVSHTNLAGEGLLARKDNPLQFLGLLSHYYDVSSRSRLPALQMTGFDSFPELLLGVQCYLHRPKMLSSTLHHLNYKQIEVIGIDCPNYAIIDLLFGVFKTHPMNPQILKRAITSLHLALKVLVSDSRTPVCGERFNKIICMLVQILLNHSENLEMTSIVLVNLIGLQYHFKPNAVNCGTYARAILKAGTAGARIGARDDRLWFISAAESLLARVFLASNQEINEALLSMGILEEILRLLILLVEIRMVPSELVFLWKGLFALLNTKKAINEKGKHTETVIVRLVTLCFNVIQTCLEEILHSSYSRENLISLLLYQKPLLVSLMRALNGGEDTEALVMTPKNIKLVKGILDVYLMGILENVLEDNAHQLANACCQFLSTVACTKACNLSEDPSREDILDNIYRVTTKLDFVNFNFRYEYPHRDIGQLYSLLYRGKNAPAVQNWVLWTLIKMTECNGKFVEAFKRDGQLNLQELHQQILYKQNDNFGHYKKLEVQLKKLGEILENH